MRHQVFDKLGLLCALIPPRSQLLVAPWSWCLSFSHLLIKKKKKENQNLSIPSPNDSESEEHILWPTRPYKTLGHSQYRPTDIWNTTWDDHSIVRGKNTQRIFQTCQLWHCRTFSNFSVQLTHDGPQVRFCSYVSFLFYKSPAVANQEPDKNWQK